MMKDAQCLWVERQEGRNGHWPELPVKHLRLQKPLKSIKT